MRQTLPIWHRWVGYELIIADASDPLAMSSVGPHEAISMSRSGIGTWSRRLSSRRSGERLSMWRRISGRVDDAGGRYDPLRRRPLSPPSDARSRRLEIRPQNGRPRQSPDRHLAGNPAVNRGTQHPHAIPRFHLGRALPDPEFGGCGRIVGHLAAGRHPRMRRTRTGMR